MYKRFILLFFLILCCITSFSQQSEDDIIIPVAPAERSFSFALAPKIGVGFALGSTNSYGFGLDLGFEYHLGACAKIHFGQRFESSHGGTGLLGASIELIYGSRHPKLDSQTIKMPCLEIPLMLQLYPIASLASEFAIEAGVTLVKGFNCHPEQIQYGNMIIQTGQLSSNDLMLSLGLEYLTPFDVSINIRCNIGTMPLAGNFDCKINTFTASAVYYFHL